MLEDHSSSSRSNSRRHFRKKGAKGVAFHTSCTYYQLDSTTFDSSDSEGDQEIEREDLITESQLDEFDDSSEMDVASSNDYVVVTSPTSIDSGDIDEFALQDGGAFPSPRLDIENADISGIVRFCDIY
jgi:hypothetical protein